jgi:hypothetical protein
MPCVLTHIGDVPILDGDIRAGDDLSGLDNDPFSVEDHQIGREASHGDADKCAGEFER